MTQYFNVQVFTVAILLTTVLSFNAFAQSPERFPPGSVWYTDIREMVIVEYIGGEDIAAALWEYFSNTSRFPGKNYAPTDPPIVALALRNRSARAFQSGEGLTWLGENNAWGFFTYAHDLSVDPDREQAPGVGVWLAPGVVSGNTGRTVVDIDGNETRYWWKREFNHQEVVVDLRFNLGDCSHVPEDPMDRVGFVILWDNADGGLVRPLSYRRSECMILDTDEGIDNTTNAPRIRFRFTDSNSLLRDTLGAPSAQIDKIYWVRGLVRLDNLSAP